MAQDVERDGGANPTAMIRRQEAQRRMAPGAQSKRSRRRRGGCAVAGNNKTAATDDFPTSWPGIDAPCPHGRFQPAGRSLSGDRSLARDLLSRQCASCAKQTADCASLYRPKVRDEIAIFALPECWHRQALRKVAGSVDPFHGRHRWITLRKRRHFNGHKEAHQTRR